MPVNPRSQHVQDTFGSCALFFQKQKQGDPDHLNITSQWEAVGKGDVTQWVLLLLSKAKSILKPTFLWLSELSGWGFES